MLKLERVPSEIEKRDIRIKQKTVTLMFSTERLASAKTVMRVTLDMNH